MRSAELFGRDHAELGATAAVAEGPAAITLCRGGAAKTYAYTDPNEDAVCFALGAGGLFAAVADGHYGARGAEHVTRWLLEERAPDLTAEVVEAEGSPITRTKSWIEVARGLIADAHQQILSQARALEVAPAPTTLSVVVARPADGVLVHASIGDSHTFLVSRNGGATRDLGWATTGRRHAFFLGQPFEGDAPAERHFLVGCEPLTDIRAIVLATDGLSEQQIGVLDAPATVAECVGRATAASPALRPLEACRNVTEAALEAHRANRSGDNIAVAALWLTAPNEAGT